MLFDFVFEIYFVDYYCVLRILLLYDMLILLGSWFVKILLGFFFVWEWLGCDLIFCFDVYIYKVIISEVDF